MKKIIIILTISLLSFFQIKPLYSTLQDFKEDYKVERDANASLSLYAALQDVKKDYEKEESAKKKPEKKTNSSTSHSESYDSSDDGCVDMCIFIFPLWLEANLDLEYAPYPYSHKENNFICNDTKEQSFYGGCFDGRGTIWYLTLEAGGQYAFDEGNAGFARLSGKILRFFGPEFEFKRLVDENKDKLDYYAFGINIPIFQFSGFSPDIYVQAAYMRGVLDRNGISYGVIINSYPFNPVSLMFRFGVQSYRNIKGEEYGSMDLYDYEGRLGIVFYRLELFGGYRRLSSDFVKIHGPIFGLKMFI